jgi:hypothetical protein
MVEPNRHAYWGRNGRGWDRTSDLPRGKRAERVVSASPEWSWRTVMRFSSREP